MKRFLLGGAAYVCAFLIVRALFAGFLGAISGERLSDLGSVAFFVAGMFGHLAASAVDYVTTVYNRHALQRIN